jgi:hypothetical protein
VEGLSFLQVRDAQIGQGVIYPLYDLLAWHAQILQAKGHLSEYVGAQDLPLRVLQHGANNLRDMGQGHARCLLAVEEYPPGQFSFVTARDQAIDTADERRLAAPAGSGDEQDLTSFQFERYVPDGQLIPVAISKRKVFDDQW